MTFPIPWFTKKAFDWAARSDTGTIAAQKQAAIDLIKAGKENGVDSMRITLDQTAAIEFGSGIGCIPIKCKIGKSGHMTIEVHYKPV